MNKKGGIRLGTVFFIVVITAVVVAIGTYFYVSGLLNDIGKSQQMYLGLSNVEQIVVQNFVRPIDASSGYDNIQNGIIAGYINGLGDKYSYYLDAKNYKTSVVPSTSAIDGGIHAMFDKDTSSIRVLEVKKDSPADLAGIQIDDIVLTIDGISVTELGYKTAVNKLFAEEGKTVTVTVLREGSSDLLTLTLRFLTYAPHTVDSRILDEEGQIGYIAINEFDSTTPSSFKAAYQQLMTAGVKALIVDVRDNADGNFESMLAVADALLPAITVCKRNQSDSSKAVLYTSDASACALPFVVLQNEKTAGAAEILTAAVVENDVGTVIGVRSAGVGLAQSEFALSNGTAIVLSVYEYITPVGNRIEGSGVMPSFEIYGAAGSEEQDVQLEKAVEHLTEILTPGA